MTTAADGVDDIMNGSVPCVMEYPASRSLTALIHKCHQVVHRETVNGVILGIHRVIKFKDRIYISLGEKTHTQIIYILYIVWVLV